MKKLLLLILLIPINVFGLTEAVVNIDSLSIKEIQEYVDKGYLTYEQITRMYLDRINQYNTLYNAVITINENAIEEAKKLDLEYKNNGRRSLVHGIPIVVKDNIDVKGLPTTAGAKGLLDSIPYDDAPVIKKLRDSGAIIIAKANMDEFAFNANFSHSSFGYVYNAYNTKYSSYGSSGGTAVGVASNLAVAGLGSDTGVSIRVPSSANNLVGLRPSKSIINTDGVIKFEALRDVVGPITKYVSDNAIILEIIDETDKKYTEFKDLNGIKIGVFRSVYNNSNKFIRVLMDKQIENLKKLGAEVKFIDTFSPTYKFDATTFCYDFNEYIKNTNSKIKSLDDLIKNGGYTQYIDSYNGYYCNNDYRLTSSYKNYVDVRNNNIKYVNNKFDSLELDAIIYPTLQSEVMLLSEVYSTKIKTFSYAIAPLVGFPAMSIPMGFYNNMPYGMEILSKDGNENMIYNIAYNLEKINNFYKLPDISPSLYEINEKMNVLLYYYEDNNSNKEYSEVKNEIKDFINNYNDISNKEEKINELILKYENVPNVILENKKIKEEKNKTIKIVVIPIIVIAFLFIILVKVVKHEKTK